MQKSLIDIKKEKENDINALNNKIKELNNNIDNIKLQDLPFRCES